MSLTKEEVAKAKKDFVGYSGTNLIVELATAVETLTEALEWPADLLCACDGDDSAPDRHTITQCISCHSQEALAKVYGEQK